MTRKIGFRSVRLDRTGGAFTLHVNDVPVFVRGANWIPDDCFPARVTRERLAGRFEQALGAGINLLRVWGGGLYESEDFYDLADERGLLVWQDFPFACAAYPEEEPFRSEVEAEARENVARLAHRPSLVLWCGNNENIEGHADWGWQEELAGRSWGSGFYYDLLPSIVAELDPTRPYWPGSPYSGAPGLPPNDPASGTIHIWDVWNREDYTRYAAYRPRFVAEFGFQGPPAYATLRRAVSGELTPTPRWCCTTRRRSTATASSCAAWASTCRGPGPSTTGTTTPSSTRHGRSPTASSGSALWRRTAWARSSGSSTTAGR
nr:hypothetical protein GCM10020093_070840 [Planobispora longispora]